MHGSSTHIRVLIFSTAAITSANVSIDGEAAQVLTQVSPGTNDWRRPRPRADVQRSGCTALIATAPGPRGVRERHAHADRPLFVAPWTASAYANGLHTIVVQAVSGGNLTVNTFQVRIVVAFAGRCPS